MKPTHTPGPWTQGYKEHGFNACMIYGGPNQSGICQMFDIYQHKSVEECENDPRIAEGMANARLIAAAPCLLEALQACIEGEFATTDKAALDLAHAALAKATNRN